MTSAADAIRDAQALPTTHYLHERYRDPGRASRLRRLYYDLKPLLPRAVQLRLRRAYAGRQRAVEFPRWPIEPVLVERHALELRAELERTGAERLPMVNFWPDGRRFAAILTHDVEGPAGVANISRVLDLERRFGFVSSWNFVAEWYPIPDDTFARIRAAGGEVGLHGIKHDGKLFRSRAHFEADLPKIHAYLDRWQAVGFRSPATHRNPDWMHELGCLYDTSFPDTDPFQPLPGGCCSILPFMFGDLVELPITLDQDQTLFELLRVPAAEHWIRKSEWIIEHHGLININTHPDYLIEDERLAEYEAFLRFLRERADGWHALPRDVAAWWRTRAGLRCAPGPDGAVAVVGEGGERATVAWAHAAGDGVAFDL